MMQFFSAGLFVGFLVGSVAYLILDRIKTHGSQKNIERSLHEIARTQRDIAAHLAHLQGKNAL